MAAVFWLELKGLSPPFGNGGVLFTLISEPIGGAEVELHLRSV